MISNSPILVFLQLQHWLVITEKTEHSELTMNLDSVEATSDDEESVKEGRGQSN